MKNSKKPHKTMTVCLGAAMCFLSACSLPSLSQQQCLAGNWQAIGYNDGVAGRYPDYINRHQQACSEVGVIPDFQAWQRGRKQGLVHYCTEANALRRGQEGLGFNAVCPAHQVNRLQRIHNKAYQRYKRQQEIRWDERKLERYRSELDKLRSGDMLGFKTESAAREYMLKIQKDIIMLERRISDNRRANGTY